MESITTNDLYMLIGASFIGIYISSQEWINIWSRGFFVGLGRLLMLNLPLVLVINLMLLRS